MSKRINVNPDHYKVAGRERPGEDIVQTENKQKFGNVQHELAARAEQRNRSIESMRGSKEQRVREASPGRTAQGRGKAKKAKAPRRTNDEDEEGGGEPRRRIAVPAGVRRIASAGATKVAGLPATKLVVRKARKTAKKTKRAAATVGSTAAAVAKTVVAKAKNAVTPRPKQALPPRGGQRAPLSAAAKPARKK